MWSEIEGLGTDFGSKINWTSDWLREGRKATDDSTFQAEMEDRVPFPETNVQKRKRAGCKGPRSCVSLFEAA